MTEYMRLEGRLATSIGLAKALTMHLRDCNMEAANSYTYDKEILARTARKWMVKNNFFDVL